MSDVAALGLPPVQSLTAGIPTVPEAATRQKIAQTAKTFEQTFLSQMIGSMFEGVNDNSAFSGGEGEKAFRSFLNDAMAKQMVAKGGIGLARPVELEMLRLQGLSPLPSPTGGATTPAASAAARLGASAYDKRKAK